MAVSASSVGIDSSPSSASLHGLDGINFFLAGMQSGFGPFVAVLLADEKWTQQDIGFVLTVGGLVGLLSQVPGGELLDASRSKRFLVALGQRVEQIARAHDVDEITLRGRIARDVREAREVNDHIRLGV